MMRIQNNGMSGSKFTFGPNLKDNNDIYKDKRSLLQLELNEVQRDFKNGYNVSIKSCEYEK